MTTVSVIIAARDAERTVERAIRSVLNQPYKDVEVVLVNDASCDRTGEVVTSVLDDRLRVVNLSRGVGRGAARNEGISMASGELIGVLDADDAALPERFVETVAIFNAHPELVAVGGQARFVSRLGVWRLNQYPTNDKDIRGGLAAGRMTVCHPAATFRRDALMRVGGYRTDLERAQDFDLARRLAAQGAFCNSERDFVDYAHPVLVPPAYWQMNRACTHRAMGRDSLPTFRNPVTAGRYAVAMSRRVAKFAATRERRRSG